MNMEWTEDDDPFCWYDALGATTRAKPAPDWMIASLKQHLRRALRLAKHTWDEDRREVLHGTSRRTIAAYERLGLLEPNPERYSTDHLAVGKRILQSLVDKHSQIFFFGDSSNISWRHTEALSPRCL